MFKKVISKEIFWLLLLFSFVLIIYCLFPMQCRIQFGHGQDANENSWWLERGLSFVRLKDVFYPLLSYWFYRIWKMFGWQKGGIYPLQVLSSIFGAGGIIIFYFLVKTIFEDKKISLVSSIFLAFSYGYWFFSIESVNNILCLFFILLAMLLLFKISEEDFVKFPIYIALSHSIAVFIEVLGFLLAPAMAFGLYLFTKDKKKGYVRALIYLFTFVFVTLSVHWFIGYTYFGVHGLKDLIRTLTSSSPMEIDILYRRLWLTLLTLSHTLFAWSHVELVSANLYTISNIINTIFLHTLFLGILFTIFNIKKFSQIYTKIILFSSFCIISTLPFYFYNEPTALEYYLYLLPFIYLFILVLFIDNRQKIRTPKLKNILNLSILAMLPIFINYNFFVGIYPRTKIENNEAYREFLFLKRHVNSKDLLIILEGRGSPGLAICYLNKVAGKITDHIVYVECHEQILCSVYGTDAWESLVKEAKPDYPIHYEELNLRRGEDEYYYGQSFYKSLTDKYQRFDNIKIFITRENIEKVLKDDNKIFNVSNIIVEVAKLSSGYFRENKLTQKFLDTLDKNYSFELVPNTSEKELKGTLLSLSRRK